MRAALLGLLLLAAPAQAATVLSVGDGDTIRMSEWGQKLTIRMACIDAPETSQSPHGQQSRALLHSLAPINAQVSLRVLTRDRYGRTVAEVSRGGQNLNLRMVRRGQAFAYRQYLSQCDAAAYLGAERAAQTDRLGVWSVPGASQGRGTTVGGGAVERRRRPGPQPHLVRAAQASLQVHQQAAPTAAQRLARTSGPSSCCGRGTATSIGMGMGRLVRV